MPQCDDVEGGVLIELLARPIGQEFRPAVARGALSGGEVGSDPGDPVGDPHAQIRVKPAEEPAGESPAEHQPQYPVPQIPRSETVAVGEEDGLALHHDPHRIPVEFDPDSMAQEVAPPPVVIATHEQHRHPGVDQIREEGENPHVFREDHPAVLEPEVEEVPIDDQAAAGFLNVQEPAPEGLLGPPGDGAEVDIGNEEHGSGGHDAEARETRGRAVGRMGVRRARLAAGVLLALVGVAGCARSGRPVPASSPPLNLEAEVRLAEQDSRIERASQLTFNWRAREPDFRNDGVGVARVEPPDRARLDLFLENGETAAIAAVVGDELRVPGAMPLELVPPPALLWAAFGVFRPGDDAQPLHGRRTDGGVELHLRLPGGDTIRFRLRDRRVAEAAVLQGGAVVERVVVSQPREGSAYPSEATYRNLRDYRELELQLESFEYVEPFPAHIWDPGRG